MRLIRLLLFLHLALLVLWLPAQEAAEAEGSATEFALSQLSVGNLEIAVLADALPLLAQEKYRDTVRTAILDAKTPPRQELVAVLDHPTLAVRLAALDLLEEMAHTDFGINPWITASSPENQAALLRWKQWAKEPAEAKKTDGIFSAEQRHTYLRDLLSDNADKSLRATRMLASEGMPALAFLENYLKDTPQFTPGQRLKVRETQYLIVLQRSLGAQAPVTARYLAFGNRDQLLAALTTIRTSGSSAMPIIHEFLEHEDPLVRETAYDSLLLIGGDEAVKILTPLLLKEPDVNVIHGTLRRLKSIRGSYSQSLVSNFLTHENEDILVSAIQTALFQAGTDNSLFFSSGSTKKSPADKAILDALKDPRWRVKAAALEFIAKRKISAAEDACLALLNDTDQFVRFGAIHALSAMKSTKALPLLKKIFADDPAMAGPALEALAVYGQTFDDDLIEKLKAYPAEARLSALRVRGLNLAIHFVNDPNLDVACAALRSLASNSEQSTKPEIATILVEALRSQTNEKISAIIESLRLPSGKVIDTKLIQQIDQALKDVDRKALDPLYHAFQNPGKDFKATLEDTKINGNAPAELVELIASYMQDSYPAARRYDAALLLATAEEPRGCQYLEKNYASLTPAMKAGITERIYSAESPAMLGLLSRMLRDPVSEIRTRAAYLAFGRDSDFSFPQLVFEELARADTLLKPNEIYSYYFENTCSERSHTLKILSWVNQQLKSEESNPALIPALIAACSVSDETTTKHILKYSNSANPLIRRAAWHSLSINNSTLFLENAAAIFKDPDARVRIALTSHLLGITNHWDHHFTDDIVHDDNRSSYNDSPLTPTEETLKWIAQMATGDSSAAVRFQACLVLLGNGKPIEIEQCLNAFSHSDSGKSILTSWIESNAARLTPAMGPLVRAIDTSRMNENAQKMIRTRLSQSAKTQREVTSFASLIEQEKSEKASGQPLLEAAQPKSEEPIVRESLDLIFFYKAGCKECEQTRQILQSLKKDFPLLRIEEHDILDPKGTVLNQALCDRFAVPSLEQNISPAVFTQVGFLVREKITPPALGALLKSTVDTSQQDDWKKISEQETVVAAQQVEARFESLTLPVVLIAGLLDGINPCAFATIIFFLSYLQIARRTPREMLMVGIAFISAVFLAYFAAGIALYNVLASLNERFVGIQQGMNYLFAALALVAAWLSLRDALHARAGRMDEMTLQLPTFLKDRIRKVIRTGAKARNFVIAAFISGVLISFLELACTGQVYAPIIYQIQKGRLDAVLWLALYNLAFVTPLIVIFLLAWSGMRSETLIAFQKKHTASVKFALALLFFVLSLFILFGQKWLGH